MAWRYAASRTLYIGIVWEVWICVRQAAFLRAINVGGHTVKMDELRRVLSEAGLEAVETFIASGNVVFDAPPGDEGESEARIESALRTAYGFEVATFVRPVTGLASLVTANPFETTGGGKVQVGFVRSVLSEETARSVLALANANDEFQVSGRDLYWYTHTSIHESPVTGPMLEKAAAGPCTWRNINTIVRMAAKYAT